jgi:3-deoxy-D-manno-octulosonic-acid transferase
MKSQKVIFNLYNFLWTIALLFIKRNSTFKDSYDLRISADNLHKTDLWIHGASGGEAYVAIELLKHLNPSKPLNILYTATTIQGLETMESFCQSPDLNPNIEYKTAWFPFDKPDIIEEVVLKTNPKTMVLLETEIWPAHLYMLKKHGIKTIIINARLSAKSFSRYLKTKFIWQHISPDKILATSVKDAERYAEIFGSKTDIKIMPNIKFDSIPADPIQADETTQDKTDKFKELFFPAIPLSILASVRKEEEVHIKVILEHLIYNYPDQVIAIFPKHMQRTEHLSDLLDKFISEHSDKGFTWQLRSETSSKVPKKTIILWDTFGELKNAYAYSVTAFVGGSLEPLGGQNFLEPVVNGTATVTGPFLNSFKWVNKDIFESKLVFKAENAIDVGEFMVDKLKNPPDKEALKKRGIEYIQKNQGGTAMAVNVINSCSN